MRRFGKSKKNPPSKAKAMAKTEYLTDLTAERARELWDYDPETGVFTWRVSVGKRVRAGSQAGTNNHGYSRTKIHGRRYQSHRLAWLITYGQWPEGEIDHINGIRSDNRISNLRVVTHQEQCKNMGVPQDNTSGVMGVYWEKKRKKWCAHIKIRGNKRWLGRFTDLADAAAARKKAEQKYGYHSNHGKRPGIPNPRNWSKKRNP